MALMGLTYLEVRMGAKGIGCERVMVS